MKNLANLLLYQSGWWSTLYLVNSGHALWAFFLLLLLAFVHLFFFSLTGETEFVLKAALMGYLSDTLLHVSGLVSFLPKVEEFPHPWLFGIWFLLSCTLLHSLRWVLAKRIQGLLLAAFVGPLTYLIVAQNYAFIAYPSSPTASLSVQALQWALLVYLFSKLSAKHLPAGGRT